MISEAPPQKQPGFASLMQGLIARPPGGRLVAVVAESALLAVGVEAALHLVPLARVLAVVQRRPTRPARLDRASQERVAKLARWPFRVLPLPGTCLRIALVQVAVLRRRGVPAAVCFGVRRGDAGELDFHAWADCDGPLDDPAGSASFARFEPVTTEAITRNARWSPPAAPPDATV